VCAVVLAVLTMIVMLHDGSDDGHRVVDYGVHKLVIVTVNVIVREVMQVSSIRSYDDAAVVVSDVSVTMAMYST